MLARALTVNQRAGLDAPNEDSISRKVTEKSRVDDANVKGVATSRTPPGGLKSRSDAIDARPKPLVKSMTPIMPGREAGGKTSTLVAGWTSQGALEADSADKSGGSAFSVAALQAARHESLASRRESGDLDTTQPLIPSGETIGYTLEQASYRNDQSAIEIPAKPHQRVAAPDEGRVVFAGGFRSYGLLLIIEHDSEYHTLLWGFSSLDVGIGDHVRAGQIVGLAGAGQSASLHVELRRNGRPVSPEVWLAASNSGVKG
ncbi:MAG: murein hydrolase activator EnvC family protein [Geminicoccaceae bacterium]